MESSAALTTDLTALSRSLEAGTGQLLPLLDALCIDLSLAVPSSLGFELLVLDHGRPTTLTWFRPRAEMGAIRTSLHVPMTLLHTGPEAAAPVGPGSAREAPSGLTLYAGTPGAFVDLAADLAYARPCTEAAGATPVSPATRLAGLRLDRDLTPTSMTSGLAGVGDVSTINRAVGWLMDEGHEPAAAHRELARRAAAANITLLVCATDLIRPDLPGPARSSHVTHRVGTRLLPPSPGRKGPGRRSPRSIPRPGRRHGG